MDPDPASFSPPRPSTDFEAFLEWIRKIDPLLVEAADEVDRSMIRWSLSLTPQERLLACTNATQALAAFHHVRPPSAG